MPNNIINATSTGSGGLITTAADSGSLELQSDGTTIATLSSSGLTMASGKKVFSEGSVLQVVTAYSDTQTTTTSTSYVTANLSTSITPSSTSNKILILVNTTVQVGSGGDMQATIFRGTVSGTNLASGATSQGLFYSTATAGSSIGYTGAMMQFLDSPNTTSSTTYTVGFKTSGITAVMQKGQTYGTITLMEIKG